MEGRSLQPDATCATLLRISRFSRAEFRLAPRWMARAWRSSSRLKAISIAASRFFRRRALAATEQMVRVPCWLRRCGGLVPTMSAQAWRESPPPHRSSTRSCPSIARSISPSSRHSTSPRTSTPGHVRTTRPRFMIGHMAASRRARTTTYYRRLAHLRAPLPTPTPRTLGERSAKPPVAKEESA